MTPFLLAAFATVLPSIDWVDCEWADHGKMNQTWLDIVGASGPSLPRLQCSDMEVPLRWDDLTEAAYGQWCNSPLCPSGMANFHVRRLALASLSQDSLWLLTGGPGQDGTDHEETALKLSAIGRAQGLPLADLVYYIPDHRGTGKSTRLACPEFESTTSPGGKTIVEEEVPLCLATITHQWKRQLETFSMQSAARDMRYAMTRLRTEGRKTSVYGGSYGTLLANRVLQLESQSSEPWPTQGSVVQQTILDGVVAPDMYNILNQQYSGTATARVILKSCAASRNCSSLFDSNDPTTTVIELLRTLDRQPCNGWTSSKLRMAFGLLPTLLNSFVSPLVIASRLNRCTATDALLMHAFEVVELVEAKLQDAFQFPASFPLFANVANTQQRVTASAPRQDEPPLLRSSGIAIDPPQIGFIYDPLQVNLPQSMWPHWNDPYAGGYPTLLNSSVLLMNGGLDSNTPVGYAFHAHQKLSEAMVENVNVNILIYEPAGHIILFKVPNFAAVQCLSFFLQNPAHPSLESCMPNDSLEELFNMPSSTDKLVLGVQNIKDFITPPPTISHSSYDGVAMASLIISGITLAFIVLLFIRPQPFRFRPMPKPTLLTSDSVAVEVTKLGSETTAVSEQDKSL